jgi:sirohydrochlorin ferrochelatase
MTEAAASTAPTSAPRLLLVAHGTRSQAGTATTAALRDAVAAQRPDLRVDLCFLDIAEPSLSDALDDDVPTVVVPALLSTGYHVQQDIPAAAQGRGNVLVARHLGPHALLADALAERLAEARQGVDVRATLLVGAGSSRPEAMGELVATADLLEARIGRSVDVATMGPDLYVAIESLPVPFEVATYLLAEGQFTQSLEAAVAGRAMVSGALGVHPAVVELLLIRYDEARERG